MVIPSVQSDVPWVSLHAGVVPCPSLSGNTLTAALQSPPRPAVLDEAIASNHRQLLSLRLHHGHWEGCLSSSALSTATAIVALHEVDATTHAGPMARGAAWLEANQNADGGWGDTTLSKSNLSTTLLCWSALHLTRGSSAAEAIAKAEKRIREYTGTLDAADISRAVIARYGKDKTFSVPILMLCAICGTLGERKEAWSRVLPLPFELAALPRTWFGAIGLPVVSYALPALIAIGHARHVNAPPAWWNPLGWLRGAVWDRIYPMLRSLQPSSGGYLEATPLTSFVTMALASSGDRNHPCVPPAVDFLLKSEREDGSWPIDTNLATWGTTLAVKALLGGESDPETRPDDLRAVKDWLLAQQYREVHPFTNAAPGGWAWTDLPGGVPDADDTSGALVALDLLCQSDEDRREALPAVEAGITWLLDLQNRDGGLPTFCRGWGALPFDRSTPEITAHALRAWSAWESSVDDALRGRIHQATNRALGYLKQMRWALWKPRQGHVSPYGDQVIQSTRQGLRVPLPWWQPLWFGNEHTSAENNPVFGTGQVLMGLMHAGLRLDAESEGCTNGLRPHLHWLMEQQGEDGGWGGDKGITPSIEETSVAVHAVALSLDPKHATLVSYSPEEAGRAVAAVARGVSWLLKATDGGNHFPPAPIGLYFARLWYHERVYPMVWCLGALRAARQVLGTSRV